MTIQPDHWIRRMARDYGMITPFVSEKIRRVEGRDVLSYGCDSFGYGIRLAPDDLRCYHDYEIDPKRVRQSDTYQLPLHTNPETGEQFVILAPGELLLGYTVEKFDIPSDVLAIVLGKSTNARVGLILNTTPGEPGWSGYFTLEITNGSRGPRRVYVNEGIGQVLFFKGEQPETTYGNGLYQGQPAQVVLPMRGGE